MLAKCRRVFKPIRRHHQSDTERLLTITALEAEAKKLEKYKKKVAKNIIRIRYQLHYYRHARINNRQQLRSINKSLDYHTDKLLAKGKKNVQDIRDNTHGV